MSSTNQTTEMTTEMPINNQRAYPKATFNALPKPKQLQGNHTFWTGFIGVNQSNGQILKKPSIQIPAFNPFNGKCYRIYSIRVPRKINLKWVKELAKFVNTPFKVSDLSLELDYNWELIRDAIFKPNKEHMKVVNGWDDKRFEKFLEDGYVFINNTNNPLQKNKKKEYKDNGIPANQYPDLNNFWDMNNTEWEY